MFERILLAVDGSDHSQRAVAVASEIAKSSGGEVLVFHVLERDVGRAGITGEETSGEAADLVNKIVHDLHQNDVKARGDAKGAPAGRAAPDILEEAKTFDAGIIVIGTRGRSDFAGLLLGSVAHKVLQHAECPVLVVR
jgi:nucleotide-binding universal stress UspA family protein